MCFVVVVVVVVILIKLKSVFSISFFIVRLDLFDDSICEFDFSSFVDQLREHMRITLFE